MRRVYYRTVKSNQVQILGKTLGNENLRNGELDDKRFCFIPYKDCGNSGFSFDGLTALWGTRAYSLAVQEGLSEKVLKNLEKENNRILAPEGFFNWYFWKEVK